MKYLRPTWVEVESNPSLLWEILVTHYECLSKVERTYKFTLNSALIFQPTLLKNLTKKKRYNDAFYSVFNS